MLDRSHEPSIKVSPPHRDMRVCGLRGHLVWVWVWAWAWACRRVGRALCLHTTRHVRARQGADVRALHVRARLLERPLG